MKYLLSMLLLCCTQPALAQDGKSPENKCLQQLRAESEFILSRINSLNQEYEDKLKQSGLADFASGKYSTVALMDNTIRKYHRDLVRKVKKYPFHYSAKAGHSKQAGSKQCRVDKLQTDAVGAIHDFELNWQQALQQAQKNANYFRQVDNLN